ncbi:LacI family transcriptional regulator [Pontibacter qinzhouensis]|uniref:LacI family transcriptional regulator n=1 Tax=Pontibacter qinzhouensis TaxID=2603253 RepID=A0A5C8IJ32_9BACT|nr:substrate-binding domain-containing protein [Pontibacter qinzhouensis]TXK21064.1 LacI family transcriptional regulator [Pontibacter qinzhouensis]
MKKVSLKDIAERLNVSKTTVSFVLNGKAKENHISEAMTQKILHYAKEVGYMPNQLAKGLRTGETKILGVMVEDISDPFFSSITRTIEEQAYQKGYKIVYCSTENDPVKTKELLEVYKSRQVDGFIIAPPPGVEQEVQSLLDSGLPLVLFDRYFPNIPTANVVVDNLASAHRAAQHLVFNNYRQIAFITLDSEQNQMQERLTGYMKAMDENEQKHHIRKIPFDMPYSQVVQTIEAYLGQHPFIDAVLFSTSYLADGGLEAIKNLNLRIPHDMGVVVFDDEKLFRLFTPSITAVAQPIKEIASTAVDLLLNQITSGQKQLVNKTTILPATLLERDSSVAALAKP